MGTGATIESEWDHRATAVAGFVCGAVLFIAKEWIAPAAFDAQFLLFFLFAGGGVAAAFLLSVVRNRAIRRRVLRAERERRICLLDRANAKRPFKGPPDPASDPPSAE